MYDIISGIIDHNWTTGGSDQQYIYIICGVLIVVLTVSVFDLVYRIFSHFWHG